MSSTQKYDISDVNQSSDANPWPHTCTAHISTMARQECSFLALYLVCEVFLRYFDSVELRRVAVGLEHHLVLGELLENEQQQLVVVTSICQVPRERLQQTDMQNHQAISLCTVNVAATVSNMRAVL